MVQFFHRVLNSPFGLQITCLTFLLGFLLSFRPPHSEYLYNLDFYLYDSGDKVFNIIEPGFLENSVGVNTAGIGEIVLEDVDGKKVQARKRENTIFYVVKSGDNVWSIAHKFGLRVQTVLWANSLTAKQVLKPSQKLRIPPTNGVYYKVQELDTLGEIAKIHGVDIKKIQTYNNINVNVIKSNNEIFIPGANKTYVAKKKKSIQKTQSIASINLSIRRPARGVITQSYRRGHYAIDIANEKQTPVYAAAGGTVKELYNSGWNYGYGKYLIIDHGNNVETLYAHNNVNKVKVGQKVEAGDLVALMGNSGRVYGPTGVHVHFELRIRGRKVNPQYYFQ